jgi:hypothetical protein
MISTEILIVCESESATFPSLPFSLFRRENLQLVTERPKEDRATAEPICVQGSLGFCFDAIGTRSREKTELFVGDKCSKAFDAVYA